MPWSLNALRDALGGEIRGQGDRQLHGVAALDSATPDQLSFVVGGKHVDAARASRAGALIVDARLAEPLASRDLLVIDNPHAAFARACALFHPEPALSPGIHPSAIVAQDAQIADSAEIGPLATIGAGSRIGPGTRIGAHCAIGIGVTIGRDCRLHAHTTVQDGCRLGDRVVLHPGAVIGADGFGLAREGEGWTKVPQVGCVILGDDVEIGANTTVDRGALSDTIIENGVKIDNLVQIAHNCHIGAHTAIAGCVGIAGSTRIGRHCMVGGAAMIIGHLDICDGVTVSSGTFIAKSIRHPGVYTSTQLHMPHEEWLKNAAQTRHLADLRERIRALEKILQTKET